MPWEGGGAARGLNVRGAAAPRLRGRQDDCGCSPPRASLPTSMGSGHATKLGESHGDLRRKAIAEHHNHLPVPSTSARAQNAATFARMLVARICTMWRKSNGLGWGQEPSCPACLGAATSVRHQPLRQLPAMLFTTGLRRALSRQIGQNGWAQSYIWRVGHEIVRERGRWERALAAGCQAHQQMRASTGGSVRGGVQAEQGGRCEQRVGFSEGKRRRLAAAGCRQFTARPAAAAAAAPPAAAASAPCSAACS